MSGKIVRALNWDIGYEQRFLAVNPLGDEVIVYQMSSEDPAQASEDMVKVHSHSGIENIQCLGYLKTHPGWTGVGTMDGFVHIFDVTKEDTTVLKLRSKQHRQCNSLSFNNNSLVAASFDKSRQDNSLQVWDIAKHAQVFASTADDESQIIRPHYSYLANEATLSVVFGTHDGSGMNLLAGGYKLLREFDLRDSSTVPIYQVATKLTLDITLDPFQTHMFTSLSEDGSVSIWDRRKLVGRAKGSVTSETPVLHFTKLLSDQLRKQSSPCFRYSTIRRGEFASVFNGNLIRRWNTGVVPPMKDVLNVPTFTASDTLSSLKSQSVQLYDPNEQSLFVALVLDSKADTPRVVSFDYSPDTECATSTYFVCMREKGLVFRMPVVESIESLDFNSYNEFSMAGPEGTVTKFWEEPEVQRRSSEAGKERKDSKFSQKHDYSVDIASSIGDGESTEPITDTGVTTSLPRDTMKYEDDEVIPLRNILDLSSVLANDTCALIRQRALLGYGVDPEKNITVLEQVKGLQTPILILNTWKWLNLAKKSLNKGTMVSEGVDLGYIGVLGVWKGIEEISGQRRATLKQQVTDQQFNSAVKSIVSKKGEKSSGISIFSTSDRKIQRKLCLIVSGWYLTEQEFDEKLEFLIRAGEVEKAAGWAVFHGNVPRAIEILALSKKERLQLMSTAVAGYLAYKDSHSNLPWNDQCRKLALELDNPYLRAIFAFIADNDWWDVLDEHALPLKEKIGIALRFLSDKDLNLYLKRVADTVVLKGELEGLILTGLTPRGIDLLQSFVDRTSDVQTASLIAQFALPRYFRDTRVDHWIDSYRSLLNSWGMFKVRALFDVARTKLSKTHSGASTIRPPPRQVYLQCPRCNKNLGSAGSKPMKGNTQSIMKQFNRLSLKNAYADSKLCPHCGALLPRCSICLLNLATQIPKLTEVNVADPVKQQFYDDFNNKLSFCLTCHHGYHAHHAEEWFLKHYVCPVPDCSCLCNSK